VPELVPFVAPALDEEVRASAGFLSAERAWATVKAIEP
jgi:hypothetical protein